MHFNGYGDLVSVVISKFGLWKKNLIVVYLVRCPTGLSRAPWRAERGAPAPAPGPDTVSGIWSGSSEQQPLQVKNGDN